MRILLTGNLGYIGPIVVQHLKRARPDSRLVGLDTGFFKECLVHPAEPMEQYSVHEQRFGDVRDVTASDLTGFDGIIHLAAISNDPMGKAFENVTHEINYSASLHLAETAQRAGVSKFVFASSCSVYGKAENNSCDENSPLSPLTAYAVSKVRAEEGLARIASPQFHVTAFRFATACGASPRLRLDLVLNDFVATALTSKRIDILSDGTPWRPLIDVKDMARCFEWALFERDDDQSFLVLNAGRNDWNFQIRTLGETASEFCGHVPVHVNANAAPDNRSYSVDFSRLDERMGLSRTPRKLGSTICEIADLLAGADGLNPGFRNSHLIRLNVLNDRRKRAEISSNLRWNHA